MWGSYDGRCSAGPRQGGTQAAPQRAWLSQLAAPAVAGFILLLVATGQTDQSESRPALQFGDFSTGGQKKLQE